MSDIGWKTVCKYVLFVTGLAMMITPSRAQEFEKNILTGGATGTYIQFGEDLSTLSAQCGQNLIVRESAGSLENFLGVRKRRFTQLGIVQSDVLEYLKTYAADDPGVARAVAGVRIALPLYNEEVHLLARRDITNLAGLNGKRVAVGVEDSGTFLTASLILDLAQIGDVDRVTINAADALPALLSGQIDAFFYVAGAPAKIFQTSAIDAAQFHLVPITDKTLTLVYEQANIAAGTYPFQPEAVDVVAVKAVLMTYDYTPTKNAYHRASCKAVSDLTHLVTSRFDQLQKNGHPKWTQVDLNAVPSGWEIGSCVLAGMNPSYRLACPGSEPAVLPATESPANTVYRNKICAAVGC